MTPATLHAPPSERYIPVIPTQLQIYDSYTIDPQWQIKFTIIWTSFLAFTTLVSLPYIYRSWKRGRLYSGLMIKEQLEAKPSNERTEKYSQLRSRAGRPSGGVLVRLYQRFWAISQTFTLTTIPLPRLRILKSQVGDCCRKAYFSLTIGQIVLVLAYAAAVIACFVKDAELKNNSNRAGFIGVSTLPVIIILSLKSPLPFPFFVPTLSYEHYNFLHRWAGRTLFLAITVHGGLWMNQFMSTGQWDQMWADKTKRGMIAYGLLGGIVITSLKPIRRLCYQLFWVAHVCLFVGFFFAISYHTPYARPWVYPCAAVYAYDLFVRLIRFRIKDAVIIPIDSTQTMVYIPDCDAGWLPTQHIFLRVFRGPGLFESHPFTITNAPPSPSNKANRGIVLYAKASGDWTQRLYRMASESNGMNSAETVDELETFLNSEKPQPNSQSGLDGSQRGKRVTVMIDGPYGGLKMDLGRYAEIMVIAGGSGVTFLLGAIEEALRSANAGTRLHAVWVVPSIDNVTALAPTLQLLHDRAAQAEVDLRYSLFLSRPTSPLPTVPESLPSTTSLSPYRPEVAQLVGECMPARSDETAEASRIHSQGGGLAVVACGPEGLVQEARNAVAGLSINDRVRTGGVAFHGETYAL